jgi:adenylate cyclase class 2
MATEIELKAWVEEPEVLKSRIASLACFSASFEKEDAYWYPCSEPSSGTVPSSGVRIRKERDTDPQGRTTQTTWVTYKTKELRRGIEVNDEREFTVSDDGIFEELLRRLGLEPGIRKHKQGWAWDYGEIRVELAEVSGLGWFVELEIIGDDHEAETITQARTRLLALLHQIGVEEAKIETRYYTEMLREKMKGQ